MVRFKKRLLSVIVSATLCVLMLIPIAADSDGGNSYFLYQARSNLYLTSMISGGDVDSALELTNSDIYIPAG